MKVKHLSVLAGLAGTALIASTANAAFTGMSIESWDPTTHPNSDVGVAWTGGGGAGLVVYRIYANFDTSGEEVNAVFGDTGRRAFLNVSGTIFNGTEASHGGPIDFIRPTFGASTISANPELGWDTFVSIGLFANDGGTSLAGTPDFATVTGSLSGNWETSPGADMAWSVTPGAAQSVVGSSNRLLIMQLTVSIGSFVEGNFGIQVNSGAGGIDFHDDIGPGGISYFAIPSPGAFALLGLAGLTGVRRRRRH